MGHMVLMCLPKGVLVHLLNFDCDPGGGQVEAESHPPTTTTPASGRQLSSLREGANVVFAPASDAKCLRRPARTSAALTTSATCLPAPVSKTLPKAAKNSLTLPPVKTLPADRASHADAAFLWRCFGAFG
jgi:hypothetical protein